MLYWTYELQVRFDLDFNVQRGAVAVAEGSEDDDEEDIDFDDDDDFEGNFLFVLFYYPARIDNFETPS